MKKIGRLIPSNTIFFSCDLQNKFLNRVLGKQSIQACAKMMAKTHVILQIPIVCSQYLPVKFGHQITEIHQIQEEHLELVVDKSQFSMITNDTLNFLKDHKNRNQAVIYGIESHINVQQSALDLLELGYEVHMLVDGISSVNDLDRKAGIKRIEKAGGFVTTSQAVIFELLKTSEHPNFWEVLPALKILRYENEQLEQL